LFPKEVWAVVVTKVDTVVVVVVVGLVVDDDDGVDDGVVVASSWGDDRRDSSSRITETDQVDAGVAERMNNVQSSCTCTDPSLLLLWWREYTILL
jgi:hypothetical protein